MYDVICHKSMNKPRKKKGNSLINKQTNKQTKKRKK